MSKAKKRSRPGRRPGRKHETWFPLRRPVLLAALGLGGWAPAGSADFPPTLELSMLDGANGFRLVGVAAGDGSGIEVSGAGDVNGDGLADLLIVAPFAGPNNVGLSGASYVVFGQTGPFPASLNLSTLDGTNGFRLDGIAAGDLSGIAMSAAGDVNGDGLADLLIGAPALLAPNGAGSGASYVVFGQDTRFPASIGLSRLDGTSGFRLDGVAAGDRSGSAVSAAGDVNGDGIGDLLIGARYAPNGAGSGASYVVFGRDTAENPLELSMLDGTNGFRLDGVADDDRSGSAVSAAGDMNGDGFADLLIGAPSAPNGADSGASYVVFGRNTFDPIPKLSSLDGTDGFRLDGVGAGDRSGSAVSAAGDVNGDGLADLLIGAPGATPNGRDKAGASYVVFGRNGAQNPFPASLELSDLDGTNGFRLNGVAAGDGSGIAVSGAGDVNGDGLADLLIGASGAALGSGASYVVFGQRPSQPPPPPSQPPSQPPPPLSPTGTCNGLPVTIQGTDQSETLIGTSGNDVIDGGGGNDVLRGRGGNDVLCGGDGRDRLFGGPGRDRLFGDAGRDQLLGEKGRDALNGGTGRDRCDGGAGTDTARRCEVRMRAP